MHTLYLLPQNSHLWKIDSNPPHYLFGTMHVPYNKLWKNIPDNVKAAFGSSQDVFVELDWADQATNNAINTCQLLPNNDTVDMHLSARVFTRLRKYMRKLEAEIPRWHGESIQGDILAKGLLGDWQHKRPIWITLLLSSLNKQSVRSTASGTPLLDVFLGNAAHNMGKKLEAMENADDQCIPFNKLSSQQVNMLTLWLTNDDCTITQLFSFIKLFAHSMPCPYDICSTAGDTGTEL